MQRLTERFGSYSLKLNETQMKPRNHFCLDVQTLLLLVVVSRQIVYFVNTS